MNPLQGALERAKAVPGVLWQLSAVPTQAAWGGGQDRAGLPFLAAVTGTAVLGLVDWPVALLVAGGYLVVRRPRRESPTPRSPDPAEPPGSPQANPGAEPAGPTATRSGSAGPGVEPSRRRASTPTAARTGQPPRATPTAAPSRSNSPRASQTSTASSVAGRPAPAPSPAGHAGHAARPWPQYDAMTVPQVLERLDTAGVDLAAVDRYETTHRDRKMIHAAIAESQAARTT